MLMIIGGVFVLLFVYEIYVQITYPKLVMQEQKDASERLNQTFYKSFMPCIYDMRALHEAYEKGLKRLNEVDLGFYFSYPKEYIINLKDELIVNGINLGEAKKCCLLIQGNSFKDVGYIENYGIRYNLIKEKFKGRMVVESYRFNHDFTSFSGEEEVKDKLGDDLKRSRKEMIEIEKRENDNMAISSENAFKKFGYVLPKKYMELYNDFNENTYTAKEMEEKMLELYRESREEYSKVEENYNKNINNLTNYNKERVGEFFAGYGAARHEVFNNNEDYEAEDKFYGSGFDSLTVLDRLSGQDKKIIEKYNLR